VSGYDYLSTLKSFQKNQQSDSCHSFFFVKNLHEALNIDKNGFFQEKTEKQGS
jgi:hypothetical protein